MRILLFLFAFLLVCSPMAQAQESSSGAKRYYNPPVTGGGGSVYVAPTASTSSARRGGPIPLQQILRGQSSNIRYSPSNNFYGGQNSRANGGGNDFSLSLSPQDVKARQAARDKEIRAVERQNKLIAQQGRQFSNLDIMDEAYIDQFRRIPEVPGGQAGAAQSSSSRKAIRVYRKQNDLETPKRIFNSVY